MQRGKISILATENLKARFPGKFENGIFIHSREAPIFLRVQFAKEDTFYSVVSFLEMRR